MVIAKKPWRKVWSIGLSTNHPFRSVEAEEAEKEFHKAVADGAVNPYREYDSYTEALAVCELIQSRLPKWLKGVSVRPVSEKQLVKYAEERAKKTGEPLLWQPL